ncbi:glycosyl hydrolase 53 family protein [Lewinella sp. IMCC34183]|uniref:glycosyl hydrolase 53 family protein n=1 Tax=Lewinella sp. IMCC34183 TaxID=2248762 RepID=UPI000E26B5AD|nr:glycosyl hydrolase 53 family protein [Lewinella sp. IMCC34183]
MKLSCLIYALLLTGPLFGQCRQGVDLSYVNAIEANGGIYYAPDGTPVDPYRYFAGRGAELARIRLWHTPENLTDACGAPITSGGRADVLLAARRVDSSGMGLNLAIHYSDYFADPGKQPRPRAWAGLGGQILLDSIYAYTYATLVALHRQGTVPVIVAIGNETDNGFVDAGERTDGFDWAVDGPKFNAGLRAVRAFNAATGSTIRSALHLTERYARYGAAALVAADVTNYDVLGLSFYPNFSPDTDLDAVGDLVEHLTATYGKEVMIFETGFSWNNATGADDYTNFLGDNGNTVAYPASPEGQRDFLLDLDRTVCAAGGTAVFYWEPAWISSGLCDAWGRGSSYENASWFDYRGRALPAFEVLGGGTTGVAAEAEAAELRVFPNPQAGPELHVESSVAIRRWRLLDIRGRVRASGERGAGGRDFTVRTGTAVRGVYLLEVETERGDRMTRRVVVP